MMVLPSLMEELVEEILLRLPPEEPPAHLVRAAMVCKAWRRILSDGGFRRRYFRFHRDRRAMPTLLGYVCRSSTGPGPQFVPTTSYFSPPPLPTRYGYRAIDCRHGRVLIRVASEDGSREDLIVCSLVTGIRHHLSFPACTHKHRAYDCMCSFTWAVLCARHQRGGCDHLDCHSGPFLVVSVQTDYQAVGEHTLHMRVSVYSSETGAWSAQTAYCAIQNHCDVGGCMNPNLLIGDALYFIVACHVIKILRYDLCGHGLSVIDAPQLVFSEVVLIEIDGGPGIVQLDHDCSVYTWSLRHVDAYGVGEWVRHNNVVQLETMIPTIYDIRYPEDYTIRFAEGTNTVLLGLYGIGVFTLDLNSRQLREVNFNETCGKNCMLPYVSFYIPGIPLVPFFNFLSSHDPLMNMQSHDQTKCDNGT
ncbi:unnamed protein product [Urochloa decumbens]|uniref:F-box domain-containing protein n=1 Tax=Urochloa decumbens TaxID=240449 RepID=A0ABC9GBL0_9POAL